MKIAPRSLSVVATHDAAELALLGHPFHWGRLASESLAQDTLNLMDVFLWPDGPDPALQQNTAEPWICMHAVAV